MTLGTVFNKTLKDFRTNFRPIFKLILFFGIIPQFIFLVFSLIFLFNNNGARQFVLNPSSIIEAGGSYFYSSYFIISILFAFVLALFQLFISSSLIGVSVKKSKFNYKDAVQVGKKYYWKYILLSIILSLYSIGLFILFVIPFIIFIVYWSFSSYVLLDEGKGINASLKRSRHIVKGRWWKVVGYILVVFLIYLAISLVAGSIVFPTTFIYSLAKNANSPVSFTFYLIHSILGFVSSSIEKLIAIPFLIFFFKNFYFEMKKKR
ncbi:MAG: hypothetical protein AABY05_01405 [Nanoarchaeota archaeon]